MAETGLVITGVLGGPRIKKVAGSEGHEGFEYPYYFVNVGGEFAPRVVGAKGADTELHGALKALVGQSVSLKVEAWNFRELHYLGTVKV